MGLGGVAQFKTFTFCFFASLIISKNFLLKQENGLSIAEIFTPLRKRIKLQSYESFVVF